MDHGTLSTTEPNRKRAVPIFKSGIHQRVKQLQERMKSNGVHTQMQLQKAGFRYTGENDTVRCETCNLEISGWTENMDPLTVHSERNPTCEFVRSILPKNHLNNHNIESPSKRQKTDSSSDQLINKFRFEELKKVKEIRCRTYSQWSRRSKPSAGQLIAAGFFGCNVGDRVICIYCNLICQQWKDCTDDPSEVHKTLSPRCPYVLSMLTYPEFSHSLILNDVSINTRTVGSNDINQHQYDQIVYTRPCHEQYSDMTKRLASFATWSQEASPSIDDFVRAGFFYTGTANVVTCFYCNGSLQNWGATDNPINEHARWFGHCPYAKQLCGEDLHSRIQEANRIRREREQANQADENNNLPNSNQSQLQINDPNMLSRLVAARLDLSNSQRLLDQNYKLSVIKRCWEDQLQLKKDDFVSDSDLLTSCIILQKQIDHIKGNKDNIIIPSVQMKLIRERQEAGLPALSTPSNNSNNEPALDQSSSSISSNESTSTPITIKQSTKPETDSKTTGSIANPCIICYQDEKRLACIPCGHFAACVPCSHSLRTCPVCRRGIEAFVRIYI